MNTGGLFKPVTGPQALWLMLFSFALGSMLGRPRLGMFILALFGFQLMISALRKK
jgi:hypothetical protein